ncbi:MAG: 3',5'-cyclic-nucleotide phosphodiesterase [Nitrospiraceae bacterium]|nr:3',5'-cyclic-nucleotide phosphodiesterase [Nitrospiraceae bacterium]
MKIRVLGCHGSDQALGQDVGSRPCRTCGFLLNDTVMVDAGTIGSALTLQEQKRIKHVLLSHLHFDHIQGLPTFADNLIDDVDEPVVISATRDVLDGLQTHIFNDTVYPNFLQLPQPHRPVFTCRTLEAGKPSEVAGLHVTAIQVNHLVPTVGFLIREGSVSILYSGDTFETDEIWALAGRESALKAALIETSFPDEMADVAAVSRHLTPSMLAKEFRKIGRPDLPVYVYHLKPRLHAVIERQLRNLEIENLVILEEGQEIVI